MSEALRRPGGRQDDSGFTLVELLVAMVVTSMIMLMAGTFYINIARSTASARATRNAMGQTSLAINAVRNAVTMGSDNPVSLTVTTPAVNAGGPTGLTVISYSSTTPAAPAPSLVTFALDAGGWLTQSRQGAVVAANNSWTFSGAIVTRRVAGPFVVGSGTPFFSYVDSSGTVLASGATALSTADLSRVAFVRVTAQVANTNMSGASDPVIATTSIGLTNVYRDVSGDVTLPTLSGGR